ncbi:MAG: YciI family protein [Bacteroidota bacterium]|nr:YciI family protein [Bacteroidota bacterium]
MKRILLLIAVISIVCIAQDKKNYKEEMKAIAPVLLHTDKAKVVKDGEMKQYFLVLLKRGPIRNQDSVTSVAIQKGHLDNITRLYNEGKIDMAGPMGHDGDLRGIFIFNCESYEEVQQLCATDPAIKAGRLIVEIYPWWAEKGSKLR